MFQKFGRVLLIVALLSASGTHWALLQSVAWTTMLVDNLRSTSFTEAVHNTFDGRHPCSLCKRIAAGKKSEKKTEFTLELKRLEFVSNEEVTVFMPPRDFRLSLKKTFFVRNLTHKPLTPPPRGLPA